MLTEPIRQNRTPHRLEQIFAAIHRSILLLPCLLPPHALGSASSKDLYTEMRVLTLNDRIRGARHHSKKRTYRGREDSAFRNMLALFQSPKHRRLFPHDRRSIELRLVYTLAVNFRYRCWAIEGQQSRSKDEQKVLLHALSACFS
jgi:hypothetical protein